MRYRREFFFFLPAAAALLVALFAWLFFYQLERFEDACRLEAENNIRQETELVTMILTPLLSGNDLDAAREFCDHFNRDSLRLSLIRADGKVEADSTEKAGFLGNHLLREEVQSALAGVPACVTRYSESLNQWMTYYAVPLKSPKSDFVLRAAVSADRVSATINMARRNALLALLLGGTLVSLFAVYVFRKVGRPLRELRGSVDEIAAGKLDTPVPVPSGGVVRELAEGVSHMTRQLKKHLSDMTSERNEKEIILNAMSEAVLLTANDGELLKCNSAAQALFALEPGRPFNLSRSGIAGLLPEVRLTFRTGEPFEKEFHLNIPPSCQTYRNGKIDTTLPGNRTLLIKGCLIRGDDDRNILLTISDLTNIRRLESFRSDFIANVSHELKTPLTCIIGTAEIIRETPELPQEHFDRLIRLLFEQATRLNLLVQDILSLSALERKQLDQQCDFVSLRLDEVARNAVELEYAKASEAGTALAITENEPIKIDGDCRLLEQAICNLIANAVKYSSSPKIDVELKREHRNAVITVRDYGVGIPAEHQERIFERFYRVYKERSRALGGTGLGLAIVKHITALHGGRVELESAEGQGCAFKIILPLQS